MVTATRTSCKTLPPPDAREPLYFEASFDETEFETLKDGLIPQAMEDKWFVYLEDDWLHFHRSWTGAEIYAIRLERVPDGWHVADSWGNRDPSQYKRSNAAYDRALLGFLIDALMLRKQVTFPMPPGSEGKPAGVVQHNAVGRAYPERAFVTIRSILSGRAQKAHWGLTAFLLLAGLLVSLSPRVFAIRFVFAVLMGAVVIAAFWSLFRIPCPHCGKSLGRVGFWAAHSRPSPAPPKCPQCGTSLDSEMPRQIMR